jgi:hypothetical protein
VRGREIVQKARRVGLVYWRHRDVHDAPGAIERLLLARLPIGHAAQ